MQSLSSDSKDVVSQRQQKIANLATTSACEMLPLSQTSSWAETADEDWLFVQRPLKTHSKPKAEVDRDAEEPIVWAKAIYLPLVDIYALPYVVPYWDLITVLNLPFVSGFFPFYFVLMHCILWYDLL